MSDAATFDPSRAFVDLDPPSYVTELHRLGEVVILGSLDDDGLNELGLREAGVLRLVDAAADDVSASTYRAAWTSSRAGDTDWMHLVQPWMDRTTDAWRAVLAGTWALHNSFMDRSLLDTGPMGNRSNCLLYLAGVGVTVSDIQYLYMNAAEKAAEGKPTAFDQAAFFAGSFASGFVVGTLTMGAGLGLLNKAVAWAGGKMMEVDPWTEELTLRWLLASQLAEEDPLRTRRVGQLLYDEAGALSRTQPSTIQGRKVRMLLAAYRDLEHNSAIDDSSTSATMPNVVGMRLSDAIDALAALRIGVDESFDAARPAGEERYPMVKSNWIVRGQRPSAGSEVEPNMHVALAFSKAGERVLANQLTARLGLNLDDGN